MAARLLTPVELMDTIPKSLHMAHAIDPEVFRRIAKYPVEDWELRGNQ